MSNPVKLCASLTSASRKLRQKDMSARPLLTSGTTRRWRAAATEVLQFAFGVGAEPYFRRLPAFENHRFKNTRMPERIESSGIGPQSNFVTPQLEIHYQPTPNTAAASRER